MTKKKKKFGLTIKLILFLFVLACAGPFFLKDKDGRRLVSFDRIKFSLYQTYDDIKLTLFKPKKPEPKTETDILDAEPYEPFSDRDHTEMYKYRDKDGVLHFTVQKPKDIEYETIYLPVSKDQTKKDNGFFGFMGKDDSKKKKKPVKKSEKEKEDSVTGKAGEILKSATDYYKKMPEALNDAKKLKAQVEEEYRNREKMIQESER